MLRFCFNFLLSVFLLFVIATSSLVWYLLPRLPDINTLRDVRLQVPLRVYTRDRSLIAEFGEHRRIPVTFDEVPKTLIDAYLAAEDDRYYQHPGVDWQALLRAAIELARTGEKRQGGSTITMQVARNFFLSREKTYLRKINEILLALKIERMLDKDAILELYVNKIYLGHRAYGVGAAAQTYYGTTLDKLSLPQLAMLAALPKAPSAINPVSNPKRAKQRRNYVLKRMHRLGLLTDRERKQARSAPLTARIHGRTVDKSAPYMAEMVRAYMLEKYGKEAYTAGFHVYTTIQDRLQETADNALRKALIAYDRRHGYRGAEQKVDLSLYSTEDEWDKVLADIPVLNQLYPGLIINIEAQSVDVYVKSLGLIHIQWQGLTWARPYIDNAKTGPGPRSAAEIVQLGDIVRIQETPQGERQLSQVPEAEGALVSLSPNDGAILALSGGFDYAQSKFNRVTQAHRQPGSNFKPFIYSAALESGYTAASLINDAPIVFYAPELEGTWRPENYSGKFYGPTRLRDALTFSRNIVSVRLLRDIGVPRAIKHAARFGFDPNKLPRDLSLALGSASLTPLQIATGYAVLANGGYRVEPYFIDRIETANGTVMQNDVPRVCRECEQQSIADTFSEAPDIEAAKYIAQGYPRHRGAERVLSAKNAWLINSIMKDVIKRGTGKGAKVLGRTDLAGKTGTTNDLHDAWFSGFNTEIVTTTWVGFDQNKSLGRKETGARAALPMWIDFMKVALEDMPESPLPQPEGLVSLRIDPYTGLLASTGHRNAITEFFSEEDAPNEYSSQAYSSGGMGRHGGDSIPDQLF